MSTEDQDKSKGIVTNLAASMQPEGVAAEDPALPEWARLAHIFGDRQPAPNWADGQRAISQRPAVETEETLRAEQLGAQLVGRILSVNFPSALRPPALAAEVREPRAHRGVTLDIPAAFASLRRLLRL